MCIHSSRLPARPTITHYDIIRNNRSAGIIPECRAGLVGREKQGAAVLLLCSGEMIFVDPLSSPNIRGHERFFQPCAVQLADTHPKSAKRLASGSTHWMRHTFGTHAVVTGMPLDAAEDGPRLAGCHYRFTTNEECRRMKAAQAAWQKRPAIGV